MDLLISGVPEQLIMEHNVLPGNSFIELKLDFVYFMFGLHVDEKVGVVKNGVH
jgi:hypothetical protein